MTHKILLALALCLGTASFAAPTARACGGGYGAFDPDQVVARSAIVHYTQRRAPEGVNPQTYDLSIQGDRATAIVIFWRGQTELSHHDVELARHGDGWRVVRFQRRA